MARCRRAEMHQKKHLQKYSAKWATPKRVTRAPQLTSRTRIFSASMPGEQGLPLVQSHLIGAKALWIKSAPKKFRGEFLKEKCSRFFPELSFLDGEIENRWVHLPSFDGEINLVAVLVFQKVVPHLLTLHLSPKNFFAFH